MQTTVKQRNRIRKTFLALGSFIAVLLGLTCLSFQWRASAQDPMEDDMDMRPFFRSIGMAGALVDDGFVPNPSNDPTYTMVVVAKPSDGQVLHVPRDYSTIQAAVNAAAEGDTVQVKAGIYNENVVVTTSDLRLHASAGAVLDGTGLTGNGIHVLGTVSAPVTGVEVAGFEVRNFERGIVVEQATYASISRNEVHHNLDKVAPLNTLTDAVGINLWTVGFSEVSQNFSHDNGVAGLQVRVSSTRNVIRANRLNDNGSQLTADWSGKGILLTGPSNDNTVLENEVLRNSGWGIVITRPPGLPLTGTFVAQNRLHDNARAGIALMGSAVSGNVILRNNATGNSVAGYTLATCYPFDLFDMPPVDNTWEGNKGTSNF